MLWCGSAGDLRAGVNAMKCVHGMPAQVHCCYCATGVYSSDRDAKVAAAAAAAVVVAARAVVKQHGDLDGSYSLIALIGALAALGEVAGG